MTISTTTNKISFTGNNSTTVFAYNFKILADADLQVYEAGVLKSLSTHYTVSGAGDAGGGNVTFGSAPASSASVVIVRNMVQTQQVDYVANDPFPAETHEGALDRLTLIAQDVSKDVEGAFRFADTVTDAGAITVDKSAADRANKLLAFDASGGLSATQEIGAYRGNWAASTSYVVRDIIKDTSNNNIYLCKTAHSSRNAQPISSNADSAKWDLIVDAASATTSQTAAASSASAASTSATASASSATASASSASSGSTSATNSSNSATASASSATASANSATASASSATSAASSATASAANSGPFYSATSGTNTYTASPSPAAVSLAEGLNLILKFASSNTGSSTVNVSSLGAKSLHKSDGTEFTSGELASGNIQQFVYNGTSWRLLGTVASTETLIKINTLDIFQNTINDMADHSDNLLETVDGFVDNFQDGSTQNNTAFNISGSSGATHDNTNKLWGNTAGSYTSKDGFATTDTDFNASNNLLCQSFTTGSAYTLGKFVVRVKTVSGRSDAVTCKIYAESSDKPDGSVLATATNTMTDAIGSSYVDFAFLFTGLSLSSGTKYVAVMEHTGSTFNGYNFNGSSGTSYSGGKIAELNTSFAGTPYDNWDLDFETFSVSAAADATMLTRAFGGTNMPPAPSGNIDTMVALIIDKRTTGTPTYEASSNAGTTWTAFSTWIHEEVMSNGYTKRMAEIDVSAHSGSRVSPLLRIKNGSTGEDYDLKAIGIKYK